MSENVQARRAACTADRVETIEAANEDFQDSSQEWCRLFSALLGTFLLVLPATSPSSPRVRPKSPQT